VHPVFTPYEFGAAGDGVTKDTAAVQSAIDACSDKGGRVVLSNGKFVCGTLFLRTNVTLEIEASAALLASTEIDDYSCKTHYQRYLNEESLDRCWIYAEDAQNVTICGSGMLDGRAEAFPNRNSIYRPMMFRFLRCKNIRLCGLRLYNAAAWTTAFLDSSYIRAEDLTIENSKNYNGDGLDFDGCHHVFVRSCSLKGTDDNLCLQSSGLPVYAVHISDCSFSSVCAGIRIGLKSLGSIRSVAIANCTMRDVKREGIKIECTEGGRISDILVSNISMENVRRPLFVILNNRYRPDGYGTSLGVSKMPEIGTLERLRFSGITAVDDSSMFHVMKRFEDDVMGSASYNGVRFDAPADHPIRDVTIEDFSYLAAGGVKLQDIPPNYPKVVDLRVYPGAKSSENYWPDWSRTAFMDIRNVKGLRLSGISLKSLLPDERPPVLLEGCEEVKTAVKITPCAATNKVREN
jgi:hypothetical protein